MAGLLPTDQRHRYKKGELVYVFYRMSQHYQSERNYLAVLDARHGAYRPRMGMSDGWVPAKVVADSDGSEVIAVEFAWPHFYTKQGHLADPGKDCQAVFKSVHVRTCAESSSSTANHTKDRRPMNPVAESPELSIITFRWGGRNEVSSAAQWGATGATVSDLFINSLIDNGIMARVGETNFEVWTVYIENACDLVKVADSAHLIFGPNHPARRAKRTCAMYFLYPSGFEEGCIPNQETGDDNGAALVSQTRLLSCMKAVERAGIPTRFPHASGFYELLASKRWTSLMCLTPHLRVPPTVALPRMLIEQDVDEFAERALDALRDVRARQAHLAGEEVPPEPGKGVVKLGFSWEALDVKMWNGGVDAFKEAVHQLTKYIEISEELTGQPHDLETIIVQDYIQHDLELRLYVVDGLVEGRVCTKFNKIKENNEFGGFQEEFDLQKAAQEWMGGDFLALKDGEKQCEEIARQWLCWVRTQVIDVPPAIRFDFFVSRKEGKVGEAAVWTLEICELGFSMLGLTDLPDKVFLAIARSCLCEKLPDFSIEQIRKEPERKALGYRLVPKDAIASNGQDARRNSKSQQDLESRVAELEGVIVSLQRQQQEGSSVSTFKGTTAAAQTTVVESDRSLKRTDEPEPETEDQKRVIYMFVPPAKDLTDDQERCTGKYFVLCDMSAQGQRIWRHESEERYLYLGKDDYWYVGDDEEKEQGFECQQGYIRVPKSECDAPVDLVNPWEFGPDWKVEKGIKVSLSPIMLNPGRSGKSGKQSKGKGKK